MKTRLTLLLLALALTATAQNISVASFRLAENDLTANTHGTEVKDQNGHTCALIKVETTQTGFTFDVGVIGITKTEQHTGEVWVYVPFGVKRITIQHQQLGTLRDYYFPCAIEQARTYIMQLTTGQVNVVVTPGVTQQFLVIEVTPPDAVVTVDGNPWPVNGGIAQKMVDLGKHEYRVEAQDYHTDAGKVEVSDPDNKVTLNINLNPAFGWLKIEGDNSILSQSSIYIDNANGADALRSNRQLKSGQHKVKIVHPMYKPYEQTVTIADNQVYTLKANLNANFSNVTLKVDDNAEIWVNGEKKGTGTWTGDLEAATYTIECRKTNHRTTTVQKTITDQMGGQTINLNAPTPINGRLVVSSNPAMAKISIDGKQVGETPMQINTILIGKHSLRLEKSGCAPLTKEITIEEGKTLTLDEKLDTGRNITVKTDREGDKVYVDGDMVGSTPCTTAVGFGQHTIRVSRGNAKEEKNIDVTLSSNNQELFFEFGRLIHITTDRSGDLIYIDGEKAGNSPLDIDIPFGKHVIHATRDKKYADYDILVQKTGGSTNAHLVLHGETASHFVERGVNFVTLNAAYGSPGLSYGFSVGSVKKIGWFVTAMSNFNFTANNAKLTADSNGCIDGSYPDYNGQTTFTRLSAIGGFMFKMGGPVYGRIGAGYGTSTKAQKTYSGQWVKQPAQSYTGVDVTAGLQLNLKGFTLTLDVLTTNFKTIEAKLGLGYCWKKK